MAKLKKHKFIVPKYQIKLEKVSAKRKETTYVNTLLEAKKEVKTMLYASPSGVARIKELKKDGKTYKSKGSYKRAKKGKRIIKL